uniref:P-loop containing nucleoside triphosphate hydrolase protein n=1 Tax=Panagrellus redivivus TaxID=6233 RepID=A0A7E4VSF2_PANRE
MARRTSSSSAAMRDLLASPIFLYVCLYLLYRFVRSIVLLESDFYSLLKRSFQPKPTQHGSNGSKFGNSTADVEIMSILARRKLHPSDIARDVDFMVFHSEWVSFSVLDDPKWQLYSCNVNYAYFVEMPFNIGEYSYRYCDSLAEGQFGEAQRVARVRWNRFITESERWRHFKGKVIALTTMPHAGSSVLCSSLQQIADDETAPQALAVFSYPDVLTQISTYCETYEALGVASIRKMLSASLRFLCKDQANKQTIVFRLRPSCIRLVLHIHAVAPHVMHVFMARDQLEHAISLYIHPPLADSDFIDVAKMAILLQRTLPAFSNTITTITTGETSSINMVRPKSVIELAVALICSSVINYKRQKKFYIAPVIYYETLISETRVTLKSLLNLCGLTDFVVSDNVVLAASEAGEKEADIIRELNNDEKTVIEQTTQLLEFYAD